MPAPVSLFHRSILNFAALLGYPTANSGGCCHGFTLKWVEAILLQQEDRFKERMACLFPEGANRYADKLNALLEAESQGQVIDVKEKDMLGLVCLLGSDPELQAHHEQLAIEIRRVQQKVKQKERPLTPQEADLFDIICFIESMLLFHDPSTYYEFFGEHLSQADIEQASLLASSNAIRFQGGLKVAASTPGLYTSPSLSQFLRYLESKFETIEQPIILGLVLWNDNHAIGLSYQVTQRVWRFMDVNQWPSTEYSTDNIENLADRVFSTLYLDQSCQYLRMNASVITTASVDLTYSIRECLNGLNDRPKVDIRLLTNEELAEYVVQVIQHGNLEKFDELLALPINLNELRSKGGISPFHTAVSFGRSIILDKLYRIGANPNARTSDGYTPLMCAASHRRLDILDQLKKMNVDLNATHPKFGTAASIAAQHGFGEIIERLHVLGADLNHAHDIEATPLWTAIKAGQLDVLYALSSRGADLNKCGPFEFTPLTYALAFKHDVALFQRLLQLGADPNIPYLGSNHNFQHYYNRTPIMIAIESPMKDESTLIVRTLLDSGRIRDLKKAYLLACDRHHQEIIQLFHERIPVETLIDDFNDFYQAMCALSLHNREEFYHRFEPKLREFLTFDFETLQKLFYILPQESLMHCYTTHKASLLAFFTHSSLFNIECGNNALNFTRKQLCQLYTVLAHDLNLLVTSFDDICIASEFLEHAHYQAFLSDCTGKLVSLFDRAMREGRLKFNFNRLTVGGFEALCHCMRDKFCVMFKDKTSRELLFTSFTPKQQVVFVKVFSKELRDETSLRLIFRYCDPRMHERICQIQMGSILMSADHTLGFLTEISTENVIALVHYTHNVANAMQQAIESCRTQWLGDNNQENTRILQTFRQSYVEATCEETRKMALQDFIIAAYKIRQCGMAGSVFPVQVFYSALNVSAREEIHRQLGRVLKSIIPGNLDLSNHFGFFKGQAKELQSLMERRTETLAPH